MPNPRCLAESERPTSLDALATRRGAIFIGPRRTADTRRGRIAMKSALWTPRRMLIALTVASVVVVPAPLTAQQPPPSAVPATPPAAPAAQPAAPAQPPAPSWTQGRPDSSAAVNLAPQVAPPLATPADKLPVAMLKVP